MIDWILTYLVHSTVLVAVVWGIDSAGWLRDPALLERLWRAALVVPVLSAALQVTLPQVAVPAPVAMTEYAAPVMSAEPARTVAAAERTAPLTPASPSRATASALLDVSLVELGLLAWALLAAWSLLRVVASVFAGRRLLAGRRLVSSGAAYDALASLAGEARVTLSVCDDAPGPMTLPGREICVPPRALELSPDELRGMLAHEYAHVVRRDAEFRLATAIVCAVLCLQPLNQLVQRRLAKYAELNADDHARELLLGDGKPLARCLLTVATWLEHGRMPTFAAAMAESDSGLLARVRRLATASPVARGWRGRGALVGMLVLATLLAPGVVMTAADRSDARGSMSMRHDSGGQRLSVMERADGVNLRLRVHDGDVRFTADETGIESLTPGATLELKAHDKSGDRLWHELHVKSDGNGELSYQYTVDGEAQPFDAAGREWLAGMIPVVLRASGIQAEERVKRIHGQGGVDAVFEEIELITSDHVARLYFGALVDSTSLTPAQRTRAYQLAGETIGSDHDLRNTLVAIAGDAPITEAEAIALLEAAEEIGSDHDLAESLRAVMPRLPASARVVDAFTEAAGGIGSDHDLSRTLIDALGTEWAQGDALVALIELGNEIGSDHDLANFMRRVFASDALDAASARRAVEVAADEIGSDHDLLQVLRAAAPWAKRDAAVQAAYDQATRELGEFEREQARRAVQM